MKAQQPQDFIPSFDDSRVIEEQDNGSYIVQEAHVTLDLRGSPMAGRWTREECRLYKLIMVRKSQYLISQIATKGPPLAKTFLT
jgi:hypothetical protein